MREGRRKVKEEEGHEEGEGGNDPREKAGHEHTPSFKEIRTNYKY